MTPLLALLLASAPVPTLEPPLPGSSGLLLRDVGEGAAMGVVGREATVMIDAGPAAGAEAILAGLGERTVDLWVVTHLDGDHVGGLAPVVAGLDGVPGSADDRWPLALWDRGLEGAPATATVDLYVASSEALRQTARTGDVFARGDLRVEVVLDPLEGLEAGAAENERGLALCIEVGGLRVLALADLPAVRGRIAAARCGPVDVLWAAHHGAADGTDPDLLALAEPSLVLISAGREGKHCHPAPVTLSRLAGRVVWMTGAAGLGGDACAPLAPVWDPGFAVAGRTAWVPAPEAAR